jgi:hypothetical protein
VCELIAAGCEWWSLMVQRPIAGAGGLDGARRGAAAYGVDM